MKQLVIVEVSQKQAYIFASNKLKENIRNSDVIAYVTSSEFFSSCAPQLYRKAQNEVYCGGGHAVLQFEDHEQAKQFIKTITLYVRKNIPGLEMFATVYECDKEPNADAIFALIQKLEGKKAVRRASFAQGTFGVEQIDSTTRTVCAESVNFSNPIIRDRENASWIINTHPYARAAAFEHLGGSKGESNFVTVVHIDGNAMGKRVELVKTKYGDKSWEEYRSILKAFSEAIADDFRAAFEEMCAAVERNVDNDAIKEIALACDRDGTPYFPVRRIITEGDDICFVTEGRIGIECARIFLEKLTAKRNQVDGEFYSAAAGIAIVHQKYPFYLAYELAEQLCSNAKKYIANTERAAAEKGCPQADVSNMSAIDWHMEFGEMMDSLEDIREQYRNHVDGSSLILRPYLVKAPKELFDCADGMESIRDYDKFRSLSVRLADLKDPYARGKMKEMRRFLRLGDTETQNYIKANRLGEFLRSCYVGIYEDAKVEAIGTGNAVEAKTMLTALDGVRHSTLFDAIECMDTFVSLEG